MGDRALVSMMLFHRSTPALWMMVSLLTVSSCAPSKSQKLEEKPAKPAAAPIRLVGRIASVPADKRFVLIQIYGQWNVPSGSILTTQGPEERTANLLATGEKLGQFAAADLQAGTVAIGDAVYYKPEITSESAEPAHDEKKTEVPKESKTPDPAAILKK